jgi:predicted TPR repeat methyltransferase
MDMDFFSSGNLLADRRFLFAAELARTGDLLAAADLLTQTIELAPDFASAWFALGDLQDRLQMPEMATQSFTRSRICDRDDRHGASLRLARLGLGEAGAGMPAAYIATLFDQYADRFDTALVEGLSYRGPALLRAAVDRAGVSAISFTHILDLGCGTGLAGAAFRDIAGRITGVDLSAGMLASARMKDIYAELAQADILAFLDAGARTTTRYDLVLAADVFIYLADLSAVIAAVARVLAPNGLLAFTTETYGGDGSFLGGTLRYAHGEAHVRAALAQAGLTLVELTEAWTRCEADTPAPGLVVVARA